ncbi:MAG: PucR family transcriptional regulator ligand-binding domain-containing protein [Eubacterium sp.]|uniref:PucR family transcriptional regulator ligand-binding domain-containing protein n=1 Tax=Eubacterium sp. TaxID=142586 RepID=UPI00300E81AE
MSLTLEYFYQKTNQNYNLNLLTDSVSLNKKITWVYLLDDVNNSSFVRGGELIITTGLTTKNTKKLDYLINEAYTKGACGVIINTGMYIKTVPSRIIEFGEKK